GGGAAPGPGLAGARSVASFRAVSPRSAELARGFWIAGDGEVSPGPGGRTAGRRAAGLLRDAVVRPGEGFRTVSFIVEGARGARSSAVHGQRRSDEGASDPPRRHQ